MQISKLEQHPPQDKNSFYEITPLSCRLSYGAPEITQNIDYEAAQLRTAIQELKHQNAHTNVLIPREFKLSFLVKSTRSTS